MVSTADRIVPALITTTLTYICNHRNAESEAREDDERSVDEGSEAGGGEPCWVLVSERTQQTLHHRELKIEEKESLESQYKLVVESISQSDAIIAFIQSESLLLSLSVGQDFFDKKRENVSSYQFQFHLYYTFFNICRRKVFF